MMAKRKRLRRLLLCGTVATASVVIAFLIYFPGRQTPIALTLATGIGIERLQTRVDELEDKAISSEAFTQ
jgi:hypothetical protein